MMKYRKCANGFRLKLLEPEMLERPLKMLLVGDGTVGKTSLCMFFTNKSFPTKHVPTIMEVAFTSMKINGVTHRLSIWDTAGQEDFDRLRILAYPNTDVFLVCYAIDNNESFNHVSSKWIPELNKHCPGVPIILVGTKVDKRNQNEKKGVFVSNIRGRNLAKSDVGIVHFEECSALNGINVLEILKTATEAALGLHKKSCIIL
uniref:Uncharacterized protein n=1 Tax=Daphnia galeata TaxID=27404 RepID=A0A8J2RZX2_9CRUS|nr:unnamed protein product [Daphnia galeata]